MSRDATSFGLYSDIVESTAVMGERSQPTGSPMVVAFEGMQEAAECPTSLVGGRGKYVLNDEILRMGISVGQ